MKENLRAQETLVANIHREDLLRYVVNTVVFFEPFTRLVVVFGELFDNIRTNVAKLLFYRLGRLQWLLGRYAALSLFQQALYEIGYIAAWYWNVFYAATDNVAVRDWYYVRYTVTTVDDDAG